MERKKRKVDAHHEVKVVFADLDGTLVHFERHFGPLGGQVLYKQDPDATAGLKSLLDALEDGEALFVHGEEQRVCKILPTSTMGPGMMSIKSIELIKRIRDYGVRFVYVTGARKSTLLERLPLMAQVDAAFGENGGLFLDTESYLLDEPWTVGLEPYCGVMNSEQPVLERKGLLWDFARILVERGYILDTRSYHFGFRVDLEKQEKDELKDEAAFEEVVKTTLPEGISNATNLGKWDFYPSISGKGNAIKQYLSKYCLSKEQAVALFDDENDLPMAEQVDCCYVLQSTHPTVAQALKENPHWKTTEKIGVLATEDVLQDILDGIINSHA